MRSGRCGVYEPLPQCNAGLHLQGYGGWHTALGDQTGCHTFQHPAYVNGIGDSSIETSVGLYLGIHCTAMTPEPMLAAGIGTARFFADNVGEPPPIVGGHMLLPTTPGLGFDPQPWWDAQG